MRNVHMMIPGPSNVGSNVGSKCWLYLGNVRPLGWVTSGNLEGSNYGSPGEFSTSTLPYPGSN